MDLHLHTYLPPRHVLGGSGLEAASVGLALAPPNQVSGGPQR